MAERAADHTLAASSGRARAEHCARPSSLRGRANGLLGARFEEAARG